jgi:hypothetical protein
MVIKSSLSAPGGGEGQGEVGDSWALADAHLTLPSLTRWAPPSPPKGRRGILSGPRYSAAETCGSAVIGAAGVSIA